MVRQPQYTANLRSAMGNVIVGKVPAEQHTELITSEARQKRGRILELLQSAPYFCQHPIADGMTIGIVHQFEPVKIHQPDHRTAAILKHRWTDAIQIGKECASIRQSSHRVEIGQPKVVVTETLSLNL